MSGATEPEPGSSGTARPPVRSRVGSAMWFALVVGGWVCLAPGDAMSQNGNGGTDADVETIDHDGPEGSDEQKASTEPSDSSSVETIDHSASDRAAEESTSDEGDASDADTEDGAAGETTPSGFSATYGSALWVDTVWDRGGEDVVEWRSDLDLKLDQSISSRWSAVVRAELRYWMGGEENRSETDLLVNASSPRAAVDVRLGESYALYEADRWSFRAGHLTNPWGSTALVRPGDVVNAVDATGFTGIGDPGSRLVPQPGIELSYVRPDWRLTGLVVPFFVPNRTTLFGRDSAVAGARSGAIGSGVPIRSIVEQFLDESVYEEAQPLLASPSRPDEKPENASLGLRWTGTLSNTDVGLGYFWGWDRTPMLQIDSSVRELVGLAVRDGEVLRDFDLQGFLARNPGAIDVLDEISRKRGQGETLVAARHRRLHSLVVNASRYVGPIGLSADVTLHPQRTFLTRDFRTVRRPTLFAAAGATYQRLIGGEPLTATIEGFWLATAPSDAGVTEMFVEPEDRGSPTAELLLVDDGYGGVAGAVDWQLPVADLGARVGGIVETGGGLVVNARLTYRWSAAFRTSLGLAVFEGPDPSQNLTVGGLYSRNDRVGLRVAGAF